MRKAASGLSTLANVLPDQLSKKLACRPVKRFLEVLLISTRKHPRLSGLKQFVPDLRQPLLLVSFLILFMRLRNSSAAAWPRFLAMSAMTC